MEHNTIDTVDSILTLSRPSLDVANVVVDSNLDPNSQILSRLLHVPLNKNWGTPGLSSPESEASETMRQEDSEKSDLDVTEISMAPGRDASIETRGDWSRPLPFHMRFGHGGFIFPSVALPRVDQQLVFEICVQCKLRDVGHLTRVLDDLDRAFLRDFPAEVLLQRQGTLACIVDILRSPTKHCY